eukprot:TRINITY_DN6255_c0_g1_i1.p1 TRINITY_DN6255_c0_g1~~TRINITY_DN6255_c0_g1_i1.p1  ORF type:complete len:171 (+),score=60.67 TRINITY_DN6255_c0_g1_i1:681-1193(+)
MSERTDIVNDEEVPMDAKIVALLLKSMGVEDYEPRVVNQLLEFMNKYISDILQDAQLYSEHAGRANIELSDVQLAVQAKLSQSFTQPPPREVSLELARKKNATPLPLIPERIGILLPPDEHCLTKATYQMDPKRREGSGSGTNGTENGAFNSPAVFLQGSAAVASPSTPK